MTRITILAVCLTGLRHDNRIFVKAGKESYAIVASFNPFEYRPEAPLFRKLSEGFELCVYGLNLAKQDLDRYQHDYYRGLQERISNEGTS